MLLLGTLPGETETDVYRLHHLASTALIGNKDGAVHATAGQDGDTLGPLGRERSLPAVDAAR